MTGILNFQFNLIYNLASKHFSNCKIMYFRDFIIIVTFTFLASKKLNCLSILCDYNYISLNVRTQVANPLRRTNRDSTAFHFACEILSNLLHPPIALKANCSGERPVVPGKGRYWSPNHFYLILITKTTLSSPKHICHIQINSCQL
jgi:hypothetical protein